jgi:hypothetical protein
MISERTPIEASQIGTYGQRKLLGYAGGLLEINLPPLQLSRPLCENGHAIPINGHAGLPELPVIHRIKLAIDTI